MTSDMPLPISESLEVRPQVVASAHSMTDAVVHAAQSTKACPFCAEFIQLAAIKCRFCGEFLDNVSSSGLKQNRPHSSKPPTTVKYNW
jgi:hypothetical protein